MNCYGYVKINQTVEYAKFEAKADSIQYIRSMLGYKYSIGVRLDANNPTMVIDNFEHGIHVVNEGECIVKFPNGSIVITTVEKLLEMSDESSAYNKMMEDIEFR